MMSDINSNYAISQIKPSRYEYVLEVLSNIDIPENYSVFVYGTGKQTKTTYQKIKERNDVEVIWSDFILTGILKMLQFLMAGYAGLIRINNYKSIKEIFEIISESSMAGIYIIDKNIENAFISEVKNKNKDVFIVNDVVMKNSNNYFIYLIDNDAAESETGIYEIKSFGNESFLKDVFSK